MKEYNGIFLGIFILLAFYLVASELFSIIRKRTATANLTQAISNIITNTEDLTLAPPNSIQVAFVVETIRDFQQNHKTPDDFLEYMGFTDAFSREILLKSLQDVLPSTRE